MVADPSLIRGAFQEMLRFGMPTQMLGRTLTREVELHGQTMSAGQAVLFLFVSANRDEREFDESRTMSRIDSFMENLDLLKCVGA